MMTTLIDIPDEVVDDLESSQFVAVLTGAGISAESGVPTFRDAQTGLWAKYDPLQLATPEAFQNDPQLVWDWYLWRKELISGSQPNPGHLALVDLEAFYPEFKLITQNVDGLHQSAGSTGVIELHGNIFRTKCSRDGRIISEPLGPSGSVPLCPECSSYLRPDVVWFGENLVTDTLKTALEAARSCEVFISIGTSTFVEPSASLPFLALDNGATVLEINPRSTPLTQRASFSIRGNAGEILPALAAEIIN